MAAVSRSSSAAPSRSEHRTWSTTHRPGAIWASEVTRDEGGGAACGGVAGGVAACCGSGGGLRACGETAYQQNCHVLSFHQYPPVRRGISVTSARTAGRASTYGTANPTESGPDCGATPGIPRNRPDHGAAGRASSGTTDGAWGNGLAGGRVIPLIRWILCP